MKFFTYIVNWNDVSANVLNIEQQFNQNNTPYKVINSGNHINSNWINVGDIRYYRQLYAAVKDFDRSYEYMFWLAGDVSYDSWKNFINRAEEVISTYNVWAYAPHLTHEPWNEGSSKIKQFDFDKNLLLSVQTDGIAVVLHRDIVNMLEKYFDYLSNKTDITQLTSGWGMDMIWCSYAIYNNKLILRDNQNILNHPSGSSYNHDKASKELKIVLDIFYEFCDENNIDSDKIKQIHSKIYGRMQHNENCMNQRDFYENNINITKKTYPFDYHIIYIDDTRKSNRDNLDKVVFGNKIEIKCLNAKLDEELNNFKKENPEFKFAWEGFKLGEVGNFGSHYLAWKYLKNSKLNYLTVFEDDILISDSFMDQYNLIMSNIPEDFDIFSIYVDINQHPRFDQSQLISYYIAKGYQDWSTLGYIISKQGAEKLCKYVEEVGMDHPTDWFIFRKGHKGIFNVYTLPPYIKNPLGIDKQYQSQVQ